MLLQDWLPVRLVATPRSAFVTCRSDESLVEVGGRNTEEFDHLPVIRVAEDGAETIVGLLDFAAVGSSGCPQGTVKEWMNQLSENILIGADANILKFVETADLQRCRLVVSGSEISGLVSLSDLQRLPVRVALFATITHSEITMAGAIRREFNASESWLDRLSNDRRSKICKEISSSTNEDGFVDSLLFTQFGDKVTIIRKSPQFEWSKTKFEKEMGKVENLRNQIAHANDYASTPSAAEGVCHTVRTLGTWVCRLARWQMEQSPGKAP